MLTIKEEVRQIIEKLPDDCSPEDIQYHLYVLQKIENGLKHVKEGRVISHEDLEKKMQKWQDSVKF
ncbi:MAG: hypothetical protein IPL53_06430 [Ignavibacteria bacterium]|nr:hypothetical protein [Ignavibacteria bacterium]